MAIVVLGLHVGYVEKSVPPHREINKRGLDRRLEVDDLSLVDVPCVTLVTGPLNIQLFKDAVLDDRDAALLGLQDVDQHFFFHAISFQN
jgi:hypothetical protein